MPAIPFDPEYGFLTFTFAPTPGADAPNPAPVRLDVYETNQAYCDMAARHGDDAAAITAAWRQYLTNLGFPPMSTGNTFQVVRAVQAEIERLGKAAAGSGSAG